MPGSRREVNHAEEEGVKFVWLSAPKAFKGKASKVSEVLVQRMRLNGKDASGRESIAPVEGEDYSINADIVINALGFEPEDLPVMFNDPRLILNKNGTLKVTSGSFETSIKGVYAAGDIVRGASLVVWGIADGRAAAMSMMQGAKK
jgi:glutamate synthase (NADPH/NADH) small chain